MLETDIQSLELTNNTHNIKNTSITGRTFVADFGNNYWTFRIKTVPLTRAQFNGKFHRGDSIFFDRVSQTIGRIKTIQVPILTDAAGTVSGTITVSADSSISPGYTSNVGSDTVAVSGGTGLLKAGDLIAFSNHKKVYMVTADVNLDGSTLDTLSIYPRLIQNVAGATITYDNVTFNAIPDGDIFEYSVGTEELFEYEANFREVL